MKKFSVKNRPEHLKSLNDKPFNLIIIGGGVTGAGILVEAQSRGLSCCLLEMQDFSEGTSSRSTKLIHGGLRYLKQWNFKLVKETGKERNIVAHIARHITRPIKVIVPITLTGNFSKWQLKLALWIYEKLANVDKKLRHKFFHKKEVLENLPMLNPKELMGGFEYVEYQTNDSRLTIELIKKGFDLGGLPLSKIKVNEVIKNESNKVIGVRALDLLCNKEFIIYADCIINATGPWSDSLIANGLPTKAPNLLPTKGIHVVFSRERLPLKKAVYFDTDDKRMVFAIPEENCVYVGTTDTFYKGDLATPRITKSDVKYLLDCCNRMFPELNLSAVDIVSAWSGIRPLVLEKNKSPSEISRKYEIIIDDSGMLSILGGKLTGYRKMAQKIMDAAINLYFKEYSLKKSDTSTILLPGSNFADYNIYIKSKTSFLEEAKLLGWKEQDALWVFNQFGSESPTILNGPAASDKYSKLPDYLYKTLVYVMENEMVIVPSDFFIRRTNLYYFHQEILLKYEDVISQLICDISSLSIEQQAMEKQKFRAILNALEQINKKL